MTTRQFIQRLTSEASGHSDASTGTSSSRGDELLPTQRRRLLALRTGIISAVSLSLLIGVGWTTQRILADGIADLMGGYLSTLRDGSRSAVVEAFDSIQDTARRLAEDPAVALLQHDEDPARELDRLARAAGVDDVLLIGTDGRVIAASGGRVPQVSPEVLQRTVVAKTGPVTLPCTLDVISSRRSVSENPKEIPLAGAAAPIPGGRGWIVVRVAAVPLFTRLIGYARPGATGETYVFDSRGVMLSRSRFEDDLIQRGLLTPSDDGSGAALRVALRDPGDGSMPVATQPLTFLAASAISKGRGLTIQPYHDYRGKDVVGAWDWIPEHGLGIAVEMDSSEAFSAVSRLNLLFAGLIGLLAITLIAVLAWYRRAAVLRARAHRAERRVRELGQYVLMEQIGQGGMGRVFRAKHRLLRRPTAIKLLLSEAASPEDLARFEREANLTASLTSPHTVRVFDFGRTAGGEFYIVMELLDGLDLTRLVLDHGPQPEARVIHWILQACDSLAEAHAQGLIHRDLKPQNLITCRQGLHHDVVKLLDFGLAKQAKPSPVPGEEPHHDSGKSTFLTGVGQVAGTPGFMAPEQAMGVSIDGRVDLYALGCCMYWLLTGTQVFPYDKGASSVYKHLRVQPDLPSTRLPDAGISAGMDQVIMRLLAKDPRERVQSAAELERLLRALPACGRWTDADAAAWWHGIDARRQTHISPEPVSGFIDVR